jgi:hypothetical protein
MSVLVRFSPQGLTHDQYDEVSRRLEEAGHGEPEGRTFHLAFGSDGEMLVSEIWDSEDQFRAFGEHLMPVLEQVGVQIAAEPQTYEVYNEIR